MSRNLIQRLRSKPKDTKNTIALSVAGVFTAFVFVVWVVASTADFGDVVSSSKEGAGAFSTFVNSMKNEVTSVREELPELPDSETMQAAVNESLIEESPAAFSTTTTEERREVRIATTSTSSTTQSE